MNGKRYTFDRFVKRVKMAEGIAVHAENIGEAEIKAKLLMRNDTDEIKFRDNSPCVNYYNCKICGKQNEKR